MPRSRSSELPSVNIPGTLRPQLPDEPADDLQHVPLDGLGIHGGAAVHGGSVARTRHSQGGDGIDYFVDMVYKVDCYPRI